GRIMRVNVQNAPRDPDNYGFIVTHAGMNLDALVDDFKLFEKDDEEFWAQINGGLEQEPPLPRGTGGGRRSIRAPLVVHGEIADSLYEEEFVDDEEERLEELRTHLEALGYDASYADTIIQAKRQVDAGMTAAVDPLAV